MSQTRPQPPSPEPEGAPPAESPTPEHAHQDPSPPPVGLTIKASAKAEGGARARVREALTCPFCHDAVPRNGGSLCARDGCGALYHRECWEECARDYGGCAVYACGSTEAHDLSPFAWLLRWLRLLTAAILFPPRAVRAIQRSQGQTAGEIFAQSRQEASAYLHTRVDGLGRLLVLGLAGLAVALAAIKGLEQHHGGIAPQHVVWVLAATFALPLLAIYSPYLYAFTWVARVLIGRRLSKALQDELDALRAGGAGGYLTRMGRGWR